MLVLSLTRASADDQESGPEIDNQKKISAKQFPHKLLKILLQLGHHSDL